MKLRTLLLTAIPLFFLGCAEPKKPRLYPNAHLAHVGAGTAQRDIDQCFTQANTSGVKKTQDGKIVEKATKGAVVGGVSAGAYDLVRNGKLSDRTLAGVAAGAATGATIGAFDSQKTDTVFIRYVDVCLADKGYRVIGWQ